MIIDRPVTTNWDDAFANSAHIQGAAHYPDRWSAQADSFRARMRAAGRAELDLAYGSAERERFDLFQPASTPAGLAVFAHGGFWKAFDKSSWSHLAEGALARGWAVCLPSYTLAPEARIADITRQFARAITFAAARVPGPLRLAGHSAGGHLATRMVCRDTPLPTEILNRITHVLSISGLHDLRPLLRTAMNATLRLDTADAAAESPALNWPLEPCALTCWIGSDERPEFIRQTELLANIWAGLGAATRCVRAPGRHHYDVFAPLADSGSDLTQTFVGPMAVSAV